MNSVCDQHYFKYAHTTMRAISLFVMSLIPTALLVFMINWKKFSNFFARLLCNCRNKRKNITKELSVHSALSPFPETSEIVSREID